MNARVDGAFDACLQSALEQSSAWIPCWLSALYDALQRREAAASTLNEKQVFGNARTVLANYRDRIATCFLEELREGVHGASVLERASEGPRPLKNLSLDDLELMDHDQVQETVELARMQQIVRMATDEALVAFNARLCGARGMEVVRPDTNPLRPDVIVSALTRALAGLHLDDAVRARWLQTGAVPLGQALQRFYADLTDLLDRLGAPTAGYLVVQARPSRAVKPATAVAEPLGAVRSDSVPMASVSGQDPLLTLDHLHQLLVGNLDNGGDVVTDQGASGSGNAMVRTLAAEVVTLMLRRIGQDHRLLAPVRDMILGLKPALLQLARTDPRFFADRENPARRLLDAITSQSLAFTSEHDRGFAALADRLHQTTRSLKAAKADLPERIDEALKGFLEHASAGASTQGLAMQTLFKVEQRNLLAQQVAIEMQARNDFARAPGVVRRFLTGPWAQVVAQARLVMTDASADPAHRFMAVLPDLLWSSQLALASRNRARLVKVIPSVLRTLREGLDAIDYPRERAEPFFQALMGLHEAAYKTQGTLVRENAGPEHSDPGAAASPWLHGQEARESGFMDDAQIESQPAFLDTVPMEQDTAPQALVGARPAGSDLPVGAWVDLREEQGTLRCQLSWASPHGTLFLFTGPGQRSVSLTRRGLERLQALGRLSVVSDHGLVEDALNAVAQEALSNSGQV